MRIEIRKKISDYPKQHREFLVMLLRTPVLFLYLVMFLLLFACETFYANRTSTDHHTIYVGGVFSLSGFILLLMTLRAKFKGWKKAKAVMSPPAEYYFLILSDDRFERGVENYWSETRNWRLLTQFNERDNAFWLEFGDEMRSIFKIEFNQPAEIDEFREFLKKQTGRG
jgi:hypothetical protein